MKVPCLIIAFACVLAEPCRAHTETISLNPAADTSLFELSPTNNLGAAAALVAGTNGQLAKSRALVRFDIAGHLPTNATITAVTLTMTVTALPGGSVADETIFHLHRMVQPWNEGNKSGNNGAPAAAGDVTWNARRHPDQLWGQPGAVSPGDFVAESRASATVTGLGSYNFESTHLVADVQDWLADPASNFGWIIVNDNENVSRSARRFGARESDAPPALLIQYLEEPAVFGIEEVQITKEFLLLHLSLPAGNGYSVQFCDKLSTVPWQLLTNFTPQNFLQHFVLADPRGAHHQRFYRVEIHAPAPP